MSTPIRLNRYLASAGLGSRRSCEEMITSGRVTINGNPVTELATLVHAGDKVAVDGKGHQPEKKYTLAMYKPAGVLCSREAQGRRKTVFDLLPEDAPRLFYVGRLDMDSEGLLILTNRGELAQQLTHPSHKLPKVYHVELDEPFDFNLVPRFLKGFLIEPGYAKAESVFKMSKNRVKVVLTQGLKRQIRLMFLKFGYRVKSLVRVQIGNLQVGKMKAGEWIFLDDEEIEQLLLKKPESSGAAAPGVHPRSARGPGLSTAARPRKERVGNDRRAKERGRAPGRKTPGRGKGPSRGGAGRGRNPSRGRRGPKA